ncbi:DUF551 domain-containing protein [Enterobacter sp. FB]|uniref:DUF551 domain-containing protein n=1 Tax=Enterobacter sp. FB TaxID=1571816 RepID=UPI00068ED60F|nr:DUF551 domain-containing protein [Enterobacter sp. FB]OIR49494.1 hypothetical protein BH716_12690 [Lelliottia nimipressuralis]
MRTITKEWLESQISAIKAVGITDSNTLQAFIIALASLEAEPVCYLTWHQGFRAPDDCEEYVVEAKPGDKSCDGSPAFPVYAAPPAPVSVPTFEKWCELTEQKPVGWVRDAMKEAYDACRAAMLQGTEPVTTANKLPDDFDFDRFNDVVWLEAVASNPHMHSPTTSTIAMVALELNKKLADGKPELTVWYGSMPESNGKANWTAILHRKGEGRCMDGFTIDRSEYPGRVLYAADRVRYLIGEKSERPRILDYDADAHSGYVKPGNSPVIPDGWVACSERMPENLVSVLVTGTWFHHAVAFWDGLSWCDLDFEQPVTHWMPLPAAPQQEA